MSRQLGREARGVVEVAHRCPCGEPDVVRTEPRLPDGTPFPTSFYATCPRLTGALSTVLGVGAAWLVERTDLPWAGVWRVAFVAPLAVPAFVNSFAWSAIVPGLEGLWGAVIVTTLSYFPFVFLPVAALLLRLGQPDLFSIPFVAAAGQAIFDHLGLLFAAGVAVGTLGDADQGYAGYAKRPQHGLGDGQLAATAVDQHQIGPRGKLVAHGL